MKAVFSSAFAILVIAGLATVATRPGAENDAPVLYYVTDPNPLRQTQIDGYAAW